MNEFDDLEKKARVYADKHPEQAGKGINEVTELAERETDHQHDEQIDRAVDAAEQHLDQPTPAPDQWQCAPAAVWPGLPPRGINGTGEARVGR